MSRVAVYPERGILAWFFGWAFAPVRLSAEAEARLQHAATQGRLVYVLRTSSFLSSLLLAFVLRASKLPQLGYVSHLNYIWFQPLRWFFKRQDGPTLRTLLKRQRDDAGEQKWLEDTLCRGDSALLFLFRPRTATAGRIVIGGKAMQRVLAAKCDKPIYLVPISFFFEKKREELRRSLIDFMFGPRSGPGRLRELLLFLLHRHDTTVAVGEPILAEGDAEALRLEVLTGLQGQTRLIRGTPQRDRQQIIASVLRDPDMRQAMTEEAVRTGNSEQQCIVRARRYLKEIAADYKEHYVTLFRYILDWVFNRIYDGVILDEVGFERVREEAKTSTLVLAPCHKSHSDYLIMSYLFRIRGLQLPYIVAGINLSFWPLGALFRGAGAFFVRRSFKNNPLYGAAFKAYVKRLLHDGTTMEFFPEGGRSRTGRLLLPKLGMFKYVTEAWRAPGAPEMTVVPVSIDYEKIIEQASYQAELLGGEKKREDFGALLKTTKVLRSRYGRVHVTFGAPIRLTPFAKARSVYAPQGPKCSDEEATALARALSYQVMNEIGRVSTVTPQALTAAVLLNPRAGATSKQQLRERVRRLLSELRWLGAPLSTSMRSPDRALDEAVQQFAEQRIVRVEHGSADGNALLSVPSDQRLVLSYYQNQIGAHVVSHAIVAVAALALGETTIPELQAASLELSKMLKHEFSFRSDRPFASLFGLVVTELVAEGLLTLADPPSESVRPGRLDMLEELAGFLDATIGAYVASIEALDELHAFPLWEKELQTRATDRVRRWLLDGRVKTAESVQKQLVAGALQWLLDIGAVQRRPGQHVSLALAERFASPEGLQTLLNHYGRFLFSFREKNQRQSTSREMPAITVPHANPAERASETASRRIQ